MAGEGEADAPPPPTVKVGDYVKWFANGIDHFKPPRQVTRIEAGLAFVQNHLTGVPIGKVTVVDPPAPPIATAKASPRATPKSAAAPAVVKDINVRMLSAGRLQITAEVDKAGIAALRQMLDKYEDILDILAPSEPEPECN